MGAYPKKYNKEEFLEFLEKNKVGDRIIAKFVRLPETVERGGGTFKLDILVTWFSIGDTFYNFELNYYSEELVEYLFNSKVFANVELSVNYLICELINKNYIKNVSCK